MRRTVVATLLAGCSAALVAFVVPQGAQSGPVPQRPAAVAFAVPALPPSEPAHPPAVPPVTVPVAVPTVPVAPHRPVVVAAPQRAVRAAVRPVVVHHAVVAVYHAAPASAGSKWACIISRESGGNPRAVNAGSGAGGLFQFLPSSWIAYGGTGLPQNASVAEQWRVALNAYARSGWSPWAAYDGC